MGLFWKGKIHFIAELCKSDLHICGDFVRIYSRLIHILNNMVGDKQ